MAGKTDNIIKDIKKSEDFEVKIFFDKAKEFYSTSEEQGGELYNIAFDLTDGFRAISQAAVLEDPRIIKVLRYITIPLFSQMKLGQFVGESTTAS